MSTFQEILEKISEKLTEHEICKNKEFYFDLSQLTPNTEFPCICFQESSSEAEYWQQSVGAGCITLTVPIEILLCTSEKTPPELIAQLWDFREEVIKFLNNQIVSDIHPSIESLKYRGASALESIEWQVILEYNDNKEIMINNIAIKYLLSYNI